MKSSIFLNACIFILFGFRRHQYPCFFCFLDQFIIWLNIPEQASGIYPGIPQVIFVGITFVSAYNFLPAFCAAWAIRWYPDLPGGFRHYQLLSQTLFYRQLSHGGSRGCLGYRHRPGSLRHLCGRLLLRQGKTVMSTTAASSSQQAAAGLCHQQLHPDRHSAVHYESWYLDGTGGWSTALAFLSAPPSPPWSKIDAFAYMPAQDFGNAFSTYIAQNYGAGKPDRIRKGIWTAAKLSTVFCASFPFCLSVGPALNAPFCLDRRSRGYLYPHPVSAHEGA